VVDRDEGFAGENEIEHPVLAGPVEKGVDGHEHQVQGVAARELLDGLLETVVEVRVGGSHAAGRMAAAHLGGQEDRQGILRVPRGVPAERGRNLREAGGGCFDVRW